MARKRPRYWQPSVLYAWLGARELEGTLEDGPKVGAYLLSAFRVRTGWGMVSENRWPYRVNAWPPTPPVHRSELDRIASYSRLPGYFAVRDITEARCLLAAGQEFQLTVPITAQWASAPDGVIDYPRLVRPNTFTQNHAIVICGYDDRTGHFLFRNSWGTKWGDEGYGYLPYMYMTLYMIEAWAPVAAADDRPELPPGAYQPSWGEFRSPAGYPLLQLATYGHDGEKVGWCLTTIRDHEYLEVEDFFVKPSYSVEHVRPLAIGLIARQRELGLKLKVWVPHCDASPSSYNHVVISNMIEGLGLLRRRSLQRWAHAMAT